MLKPEPYLNSYVIKIYHNFCLCLYFQIQKNSFYFLTM